MTSATPPNGYYFLEALLVSVQAQNVRGNRMQRYVHIQAIPVTLVCHDRRPNERNNTHLTRYAIETSPWSGEDIEEFILTAGTLRFKSWSGYKRDENIKRQAFTTAFRV